MSAAVVTGGAGDIGRAILARLAEAGFVPVSWDIEPPPPGVAGWRVDVTDASVLAGAAAETDARHGPIRALVVNAGVLGPVARLWEIPPAEIARVLAIDLLGALLTLNAVVPRMRAAGAQAPGPARGRIVLMGSVQGKEGTARAAPYAAAKAGLMAAAKSLARELAPDGILVNVVTPTVVAGRMEASIDADRRAELLARIPLGRFLAPGEVAEMVAWLVSPACTFSTGAVFDLSGGRASW
ncbi:MAG: SDR family oxidoreductase [Rhodospirillales bacterium]|nr:SDR family oxidoreductase [Rhodospirillales bacterium]